jgi:hypothetical protein
MWKLLSLFALFLAVAYSCEGGPQYGDEYLIQFEDDNSPKIVNGELVAWTDRGQTSDYNLKVWQPSGISAQFRL